MHCSRSKIPSKKSHPYIYVKFLALLEAPFICDISRLRVKMESYTMDKYIDVTVVFGCVSDIVTFRVRCL
jgi:hypothetical protein